jgi:hypothetical protein
VNRLANAFPNVSRAVTSEKVANWFKETNERAFKLEVADYLVLINRYSIGEFQEGKK